MTQMQTIIEFTFTSLVLVIASLAFAAYSLLFYTVMIALDGCELCKRMHNRQIISVQDTAANTLDQGHSLSRT